MIQLDLDHLKQPMKPLKQMYNNLNIYPLHHPAIRTLVKKEKEKKKSHSPLLLLLTKEVLGTAKFSAINIIEVRE